MVHRLSSIVCSDITICREEQQIMDNGQYRIERDSLGDVQVPDDALYGAQTARAIHNFPITGLRPHPALVRATVLVKRAAAETNRNLEQRDAERANAIIAAADRVLEGA